MKDKRNTYSCTTFKFMRNTGSGTTIRTKLKACPNIPPEDDLYTLMQMNLIENEISDSVVICESKKKKKNTKNHKSWHLATTMDICEKIQKHCKDYQRR